MLAYPPLLSLSHSVRGHCAQVHQSVSLSHCLLSRPSLPVILHRRGISRLGGSSLPLDGGSPLGKDGLLSPRYPRPGGGPARLGPSASGWGGLGSGGAPPGLRGSQSRHDGPPKLSPSPLGTLGLLGLLGLRSRTSWVCLG